MSPKELDAIMMAMSEDVFEGFVNQLPEDAREIVMARRAFLEMFSNEEKYNAIQNAVKEMVMEGVGL